MVLDKRQLHLDQQRLQLGAEEQRGHIEARSRIIDVNMMIRGLRDKGTLLGSKVMQM